MNLSTIFLAISLAVASFSLAPMEPLEPTLKLLDNDTITPITVEEYVARVVAHEMPYTFCEEALKAQAVAARTYLYYCLDNASHPHDNADVCTDVAHCCGYITEEELDKRYGNGYGERAFARIRAAAEATKGQVVAYNGKPLLSVWHASSEGSTEACSAVWQQELPYLVSVSTPEKEEPYTVSFTYDDVCARLGTDNLSPKFPVRMTLTASGRCETLMIEDIAIDGCMARTLFGLKSTSFIAWQRGGKLYFRVSGYGHGVGMSQVGANVMAQNGATYSEILEHYYVGSKISEIK